MKRLTAMVIMLALLTSCFALPVEESVPPPPILQGGSGAVYKTVEVRRGDVVLHLDLPANYVPAQEESLGFDIGDEVISAVYADVGDIVQAGDILAELDRTYYQEELEKLAREEAWARLELAQLDDRHELSLAEALVSDSQVDEAAYMNERAALLTQLETLRIRKEYLVYEDQRRILRAGLSGTVMTAPAFQDGMQSVADRNIFTIADQSNSVFMVRGTDTKHIRMGEEYSISINWEPYTAEVVDPAVIGISRSSDEETYLVLVGDEPPGLSARDFVSLRVVLDVAENTLYLPYTAIKKANARTFVYVLTDGVRTIRDVEIGLEGNTLTEIISGVAEGEEIIQE